MHQEPATNVIPLHSERGLRTSSYEISAKADAEIKALNGRKLYHFLALWTKIQQYTPEALRASSMNAIRCGKEAILARVTRYLPITNSIVDLHFKVLETGRLVLTGVRVNDPPPDGGGSPVAAALASNFFENRLIFAAHRFGQDGLAIAAALVAACRGELSASAFDALCHARRILTGIDPMAIAALVLHEALHAGAAISAAALPPGDGLTPYPRTLPRTCAGNILPDCLRGVRLRLPSQRDAAARFPAVLLAVIANDE